MTISERIVSGVAILDIDGPITIGPESAELLSDKIRSLLQQQQTQLIVNLANVPYIDSTGLGALVHSFATATRQGGTLKLLNSTKKLHDLLVITKLATVFDLYDSEAAAVGSFRASV
jgi:anti-sigma B factor antagonist